ncbi:addiction module toxin RelE [Candidatus Woesearchaeota archaeon]|nr:addiction module toxin RelE [Candidatus Woesearchaeota archaeon]
MYELDIKPKVFKIFMKLGKKNQVRLSAIHKKIDEIRSNPFHKYKFLKSPLQNFNRVHVDTHFVLIFQINHKEKKVEIFHFDHHDYAYK